MTTSAMPAVSTVGALLRRWRRVRGRSQLALALDAGVSARHLSFIETGRSEPSRGMVMRLAEALDLPLRDRNALLSAAGYAPRYPETSLEGEQMDPVRVALEHILRSHEPYPAFVLDRRWNVLMAAPANAALAPLFVDRPEQLMLSGDPPNVLRMVFHPEILRPRLENWAQVVHVLGGRLERRLHVPDPDRALRALRDELFAYPDVAAALERPAAAPHEDLLIPMRLRAGAETLSWFTTITTVGTPLDVTLDELYIETMFPADRTTREAVREFAARAGAPPDS